jgi:hypothetical protein
MDILDSVLQFFELDIDKNLTESEFIKRYVIWKYTSELIGVFVFIYALRPVIISILQFLIALIRPQWLSLNIEGFLCNIFLAIYILGGLGYAEEHNLTQRQSLIFWVIPITWFCIHKIYQLVTKPKIKSEDNQDT